MNNTTPDIMTTDISSCKVIANSHLLDGLQPAFKNTRTGELHLSQTKDGEPADVYEFTGLPDYWIAEHDNSGNAIALKPEVIAGYWVNGKFIALSKISSMPYDA